MLPRGFKFLPNWRFGDNTGYFSDSGSPEKITYTPVFDKNGVLSLEATGKQNIYELIQANKDSCDLNILMARVRETGDSSIIDRVQGFYMDAADLPDNWPDVINSVNALKDGFERMPVSFKELYGNDFLRFAATFDPSSFYSVESGGSPSPVLDSEPGVTSEKDGASDES